MAAGEGTRLRPLTERWPKPVLPIDGRPVIATLLRELATTFGRVTVVTGHLAEQVEQLLGDGDGYGARLTFARQPVADGSAGAVQRALTAGAVLPAVITAADTVFTRGDIARFAEAFAASGAIGALAVRRVPPPGPGRAAVRFEAGRITRVVDDEDRRSPFAAAPLWGFAPEGRSFLDELPGPPFELAAALQRAIDEGAEVLGVEVGPTRDLTDPLDLVRENFPYLRWST